MGGGSVGEGLYIITGKSVCDVIHRWLISKSNTIKSIQSLFFCEMDAFLEPMYQWIPPIRNDLVGSPHPYHSKAVNLPI